MPASASRSSNTDRACSAGSGYRGGYSSSGLVLAISHSDRTDRRDVAVRARRTTPSEGSRADPENRELSTTTLTEVVPARRIRDGHLVRQVAEARVADHGRGVTGAGGEHLDAQHRRPARARAARPGRRWSAAARSAPSADSAAIPVSSLAVDAGVCGTSPSTSARTSPVSTSATITEVEAPIRESPTSADAHVVTVVESGTGAAGSRSPTTALAARAATAPGAVGNGCATGGGGLRVSTPGTRSSASRVSHPAPAPSAATSTPATTTLPRAPTPVFSRLGTPTSPAAEGGIHATVAPH